MVFSCNFNKGAFQKQTVQNGTTEEPRFVLGSSWVVISGVISKVTILITLIRGLVTLLITTHEPPREG